MAATMSVLGLVGVAAVPVSTGAVDATAAGGSDARVVVGVLDTDVNAYHDWFHQGGPLYGGEAPSSVTPELLAELGIDDDHILRLTRTGTWELNVRADREQLDAVNDGELYWYEGTNLIAVSFDREDELQLLPDEPGGSHGTATVAAVLAANPDAVVISVSPWSTTDRESNGFIQRLQSVDILNSSFGWIAGIPYPLHAVDSYEGVLDHGKLHFGAAGNSPPPDTWSHAGGPWWLMGVGAYHEDPEASQRGAEPDAATLPEFVSDYKQELPDCSQCMSSVGAWFGTSFSSPRAAGTASLVLQEARRLTGHRGGIVRDGLQPPAMVATDAHTITNWQVRRALEEAAAVPAFEPTGLTGERVPINPVYPWPQVGWGLLSPDPAYGVVDEALAQLGLTGAPTRVKPQEACDFMLLNQELRRTYWDNLFTSDSFGQDRYPYIECG